MFGSRRFRLLSVLLAAALLASGSLLAGNAVAASSSGYWLVGADGKVYEFAGADQLSPPSRSAGAPPGLVAYTVHPWVVANDRLRSLGWQAANTNEEAYVLGHQPTQLDKLTSRRRQQIALGVAGGVVAAIAAVTVGLVLRHRASRRLSRPSV